MVAELKKNNLMHGAIIALETDEDNKVLWPAVFEGQFLIF